MIAVKTGLVQKRTEAYEREIYFSEVRKQTWQRAPLKHLTINIPLNSLGRGKNSNFVNFKVSKYNIKR